MTEHAPGSAIVSGGGGGIGSVVAERLASLGHSVVVADANAEAAERVAGSLPTVADASHTAVSGDLTTRAVNRAAVEAAVAIAPLMVVVNAVGISPKDEGRKREFQDIGEDEWDLVMAVNVKAPLLLVQEAVTHMPEDGSASIVSIHSITSRSAAGGRRDDAFWPQLPSSAAYAASKAALLNLTASLSRELSSRRIRVNGVAPGFVATQMTGVMPDAETQRMTSQVPMGRFGTPQEVADAIEFLVSSRSSYITGASLDVNGGWLTC